MRVKPWILVIVWPLLLATEPLVIEQSNWSGLLWDNSPNGGHDLVIQNIVEKTVGLPSSVRLPVGLDVIIVNELPILVKRSEGKIESRPLAYPNPMPFRQGSGVISYSLNQDMEIELRIYNMRGYQVFERSYASGFMGGKAGYNEIPITISEIGRNLATGLYAYLLFYNGDVAGKGKFVVIP